TWSAWSRDGGAEWAEARPTPMNLRLRIGPVAPGEGLPKPGLDLPSNGRLFIVQFRTVSLPEWRAALEQAGATVLGFFPDNAHVVRMDPALAGRVGALEFVQRVEPYRAADRLEGALQDWLGTAGPPEQLRVNAVVFEWGESGKQRLASAAVALG